ncbi:MAG: SusD/RagB family nutrient-binding outer membrane lipoprotein, partial [Flavitalea sp.]
MRLYKYSFLVLGLALLLSSCTKDLAEINKNPNASEEAQPDYLLTAASKAASDTYWGTANNMDATLLFVQHWAKIQYTDPDRYIYTNTAFQELWTVSYSKVIVNLNQIITIGEEQENPNYKGVALVLRSWIFSVLTDSYGDIPYTQAGKIKEYLTPAYDKQKDVYFALLEDLKTAQGLLDPSGKAIAGDVIYSNNITSWKKFANSLRYRIALRIADKEPAKAREVIAEIGTAADAVIGSNSETAKFGYLDSPNQNPISNLFDTRDDYRISKAVTDKLRTLNDPRLSIYSSPTQTATADTYVG